jgi:hypothetical protein
MNTTTTTTATISHLCAWCLADGKSVQATNEPCGFYNFTAWLCDTCEADTHRVAKAHAYISCCFDK